MCHLPKLFHKRGLTQNVLKVMSHAYVKFNVSTNLYNKIIYLQNFFSYAPHKKKRKRATTPKVLMLEGMSLMLPLIILCSYMKLHYNNIRSYIPDKKK